MVTQSDLPIAFAVPYGDQMLAGAWGMIKPWPICCQTGREIMKTLMNRKRLKSMVIHEYIAQFCA